MAVVGNVIIGISAKLDGLDNGLKKATQKLDNFGTAMRKQTRYLRQMVGGFGALAIAGRAVSNVDRLTKAMAANGSVGATRLVKSMESVKTSLLDVSDTIFGPAMAGWAALGEAMSRTSDPKIGEKMRRIIAPDGNTKNTIYDPKFRSLLIGGFDGNETLKGLEKLKELQDHMQDLQRRGMAAEGLTKGMNIHPELKRQIDEADQAIKDLKESFSKWSNMGSEGQESIFEGVSKAIDSIHESQAAEESHRMDVLEREVSEFEKLQEIVDKLDEDLKGPNEKLDEFIDKIEQARKANLMTDFQAERAIEAERKKLFGEKDKREPIETALRGSSEAFSAIAKFRNGRQDKIPSQMLGELKGIRRAISKDSDIEVAGLR